LGQGLREKLYDSLDNDFNSAAALAHLFELARALNRFGNHKQARKRGGPDEGPEMAYICVAGQKHYWQDGEVMVFDPSFLHETFNPTSQDRIILNIDIFHPELTDLECNVIRETICLKKQMFGSTPEEVHPDRAPGR